MLYNAMCGVPRDFCILCNAALANAFTLARKTVNNDPNTDRDMGAPTKSARLIHVPLKTATQFMGQDAKLHIPGWALRPLADR